MNIDLESIWPPRKKDILYQDIKYLGGSLLKVTNVIVPLWKPPDDCIMRCIILHDTYTSEYLDNLGTTHTASGVTIHITKDDLRQLDSKLYLVYRVLR